MRKGASSPLLASASRRMLMQLLPFPSQLIFIWHAKERRPICFVIPNIFVSRVCDRWRGRASVATDLQCDNTKLDIEHSVKEISDGISFDTD